jgi:hypothetical protein
VDAIEQFGEDVTSRVRRRVAQHPVERASGDAVDAIGGHDGSLHAGCVEAALGTRRRESVVVAQPHFAVGNSSGVRADGPVATAEVQYPLPVFDDSRL